MKGILPLAVLPLMLLATPASAQVFAAATVDDATLGSIAGREDTNQLSVANNTNNVSNNSVGDNSTTGTIGIADNAFQNLSGLSILSVNSGNNVAINSAMNVNIAITPAP